MFFKFILSLLFSIGLAQADTIKVRIWCGFPSGGATDQQVRMLQKHLTDADPALTVTVEYRPGAAGVVGMTQFINNRPGEYVELIVDGTNQMMTSYITKTAKYNLEKDIDLMYPIGYVQSVVLVNKKLNVNNIDDLKVIKKDLNYGSAGVGSISHVTTAYLENYINRDLLHVPYKSPVQALPDLINGRIDLLADYVISSAEHVRSGAVGAIAVTGPRRSSMLPSVKTFTEQGINDYPIDPWFAVFGNVNNDPDKTKYVKSLIFRILTNPEIQKEYSNKGVLVISQDLTYPANWYSNQIRKYKNLSQYPKFANLTD